MSYWFANSRRTLIFYIILVYLLQYGHFRWISYFAVIYLCLCEKSLSLYSKCTFMLERLTLWYTIVPYHMLFSYIYIFFIWIHLSLSVYILHLPYLYFIQSDWTQNSELRNLFIQPLDYRFSTKHNQIIIMFKIGVWETFVKTKRKVAGTDATHWNAYIWYLTLSKFFLVEVFVHLREITWVVFEKQGFNWNILQTAMKWNAKFENHIYNLWYLQKCNLICNMLLAIITDMSNPEEDSSQSLLHT